MNSEKWMNRSAGEVSGSLVIGHVRMLRSIPAWICTRFVPGMELSEAENRSRSAGSQASMAGVWRPVDSDRGILAKCHCTISEVREGVRCGVEVVAHGDQKLGPRTRDGPFDEIHH